MGFWNDNSLLYSKKQNKKVNPLIIFLVLLIFFGDDIVTYVSNYIKDLTKPEVIRQVETDHDLWKVEEPYVVLYDDYLINSEGKSVYLPDSGIYNDHPKTAVKKFEAYTDASRKHVLIHTSYNYLYIFDANLNMTFLGDDVTDAGMSLDGSRVFYIKDTPVSKESKYIKKKKLYIYEPYGQYKFGRQFGKEEYIYASISPNGKYLVAYKIHNGTNMMDVIDIDNDFKTLYSIKEPEGKNEKKYYSMYVSNDGRVVYCKIDLSYLGNRKLVVFEDGNRIDIGKDVDYDYAIFNSDMTGMVYGFAGGMYYYREDSKSEYPLFYAIEDGDIYLNKRLFTPSTEDVRIKVVTDPGLGGIVVRGTYNTYCFEDEMERTIFQYDFRDYKYSYYEDDMMVFYYTDHTGVLQKAVVSDGEVRTSEYENIMWPLQVTSNESHNKVWVLTRDYEIYCIDGSDDTVTYVKTISKSYGYEGSYTIRYSMMDKRLYYMDDSCLYSLDPETLEEYLVTDNCVGIEAPEGEEYLLHYYIGNNENEYIQIGTESVRIR